MVDATTESRICAHRVEGDSRRCAGCGEPLHGRDLAEARRARAQAREGEAERRRAEIAERARPASAKLARALHMLPGLAVALAGLPPRRGDET